MRGEDRRLPDRMHVRAYLIGAVLAFVIAFAMRPEPVPREAAASVVAIELPASDGVIDLARSGGVITPPSDFADARPWPLGMVIEPPPPRDRIAVPIADLVALFLRPFTR